jgi:hypothetical protein
MVVIVNAAGFVAQQPKVPKPERSVMSGYTTLTPKFSTPRYLVRDPR